MKTLNTLILVGMSVVGLSVIGMSVRPLIAPAETPAIAQADDYVADDYLGYLSMLDRDEIDEIAHRKELALRDEIDRRERIDAEDSMRPEDLTGSFAGLRNDDDIVSLRDDDVYLPDNGGIAYRWFDDE
jgi:hypothetical protein